MLKCPKQQPNCLGGTETNVALIACNDVFYHVRAYNVIVFTVHSLCINYQKRYILATDHNTTLSSQCNLTAPREPMKDNKAC